MNIKKITSTLVVTVLFAGGILAQSAKQPDLYDGIEFRMPKVQEPVIPKNSVSITDFGAKNGGQELCTKAFVAAIDAVAKKGGGRVVIPHGTWLTGPITLKSNIELYSEVGALIIFSPNKDLYPLVETIFEGSNTFRCMSPINGRDLENVAITGHGIFDGSGEAWRAVKKEKLTEAQWKKQVASGGIVGENGKTWYPSQQFLNGEQQSEMNVPRSLKTKAEFEGIRDFLRPVMVSLVSCKKILFDGPTFQNSPAWCIHPLMCEDFTFRNMTIRNPWYSQNGDGIDIESCTNSVIHDCSFDVGDDAICIKSGKDKEGRDRHKPNENLVVKNCIVFHGHGGVTVGSEMSGGVKNLHVSNCTFLGTDVGLRFKSNRGRGGVVENIYISDIEMMDIPTQAISFNLFYSGRSASEDLKAGETGVSGNLLPVTEETPRFRNIFIKNVNCKGALLGIQLQGLPEMNLENVEIENINMEADNGMTCCDAKNVKISNMKLLVKNTPVVDLKNSSDVLFDGIVSPCNGLLFNISGNRTGKIYLKQAGITNTDNQLMVGKEVTSKNVKIIE